MKRSAPMEAMRFEGALQRILRQVLTFDPLRDLVYLSKVDMDDAYMRLWVRMEDVPSLAFLILKNNPSYLQLVGFYLFLPMGCVDRAPYFFLATETLSDLTNNSISHIYVASAHLL